MCPSFTVEADGANGMGWSMKTVLNSASPVTKYCYDCRRIVWTKIKYYPTLKTRIIAVVLSPCLLCWVPFFCHWKAELDHHCSFCDSYLGTYNPLFEHKILELFTAVVPSEKPEEKKQPQKRYREVGRRCREYRETLAERDEIIRVYSDIIQPLISCVLLAIPSLRSSKVYIYWYWLELGFAYGDKARLRFLRLAGLSF